MQKKLHHIIIVPGLGDDLVMTAFWTKKWKSEKNVKIELWSAHWADPKITFEQKYQRLLQKVKKTSQKNKVSLVGISAGASLVCYLFAKNPTLVHKVINVCGRLRMAKRGLPTLELITFRIPSFKTAVHAFESIESTLTKAERKRVLTFRSLYDDLVPTSTISINGAKNIVIPIMGHNISIAIALSLKRSTILDFIKS